MSRVRAGALIVVTMLATTAFAAKAPRCTPRRKECRAPLSRCVANMLAAGCPSGNKKRCKAHAKRACRADVKSCCQTNLLLAACCNATVYPPGTTTTTLPGGPNASLNVTIVNAPEGAPGPGWRIEEHFPPEGTPPRISCPPTCAYQAPTPTLDVGDLIVVPVNDPRTGNPPWNVISMDQCAGTSSLPSPAPLCTPPTAGHVSITVTLQYRPIVAITFAGTTGDPGEAYVQAYSTPPFGLSYGLSCYSDDSTVADCAEHLDQGTGWQLRTVSHQLPDYDVPYELVSWSPPCIGGVGPGENLCCAGVCGAGSGFLVPANTDVCVTATFQNPSGVSHSITGNPCPTGPGDR